MVRYNEKRHFKNYNGLNSFAGNSYNDFVVCIEGYKEGIIRYILGIKRYNRV